MKIAVYTIALSEAANAQRWADSTVGADYRIGGDTGSSDDTVERMIRADVTVHTIAIQSSRFDDARNAALALLPDDVDVCCAMDMDRWLALGWRPALEAAWTTGTTALYNLQPTSADDSAVMRSRPAKNLHHRWGYRFRRPVQEALIFSGETEVMTPSNDIVIYEVQDHSKPTHKQYLPLMELAHKEDPDDAQICFWLGLDYMWTNQPEKDIELMQRDLALPPSTWGEERAEAMRCLAIMQPDKKLRPREDGSAAPPGDLAYLAEEFLAQAEWVNVCFWANTNGKSHRTGSYRRPSSSIRAISG